MELKEEKNSFIIWLKRSGIWRPLRFIGIMLAILVLVQYVASIPRTYYNACLGYSFKYPRDLIIENVGSDTRHEHPQIEKLDFLNTNLIGKQVNHFAATVVVTPMDDVFVSAQTFRYSEWGEDYESILATSSVHGNGWYGEVATFPPRGDSKIPNEWIHIRHDSTMISFPAFAGSSVKMRRMFLETLRLFEPDRSKCVKGDRWYVMSKTN